MSGIKYLPCTPAISKEPGGVKDTYMAVQISTALKNTMAIISTLFEALSPGGLPALPALFVSCPAASVLSPATDMRINLPEYESATVTASIIMYAP